MNEFYKTYYKSEIGILELTASDKGITALGFAESIPDENYEENKHIKKCIKQLNEYFKGERKEFSIDLDFCGTEFQNNVWTELLKIPYGETRSYINIAVKLGDENAVRAVGMANNRNPIAIIVPCHRVIGSDGKLVGYAGGLWRKDWLLKREKEFSDVEIQMELF